MVTAPKKRLSREETKQLPLKNFQEDVVTIFTERGSHSSSIDDIATAAGYTKGALWAHFDKKNDLSLALLDENIRQPSRARKDFK